MASSELTVEEMIQLYDAMMSSINAQLQLWITVTFAVIIASHVAGANFSRPLRYLIAALYLSVSMLVVAMMGSAVNFGATGGIDFFSGERVGDELFIVLLPLVWIIGSAATVVFIFNGGRKGDQVRGP